MFSENASFDESDTRAEKLPLPNDPNNDDIYIDDICYFVYGRLGCRIFCFAIFI